MNIKVTSLIFMISLVLINPLYAATSNVGGARGKILHILLVAPGSTAQDIAHVVLDVVSPDPSICGVSTFESGEHSSFAIKNDYLGKMHLAMLTAVKLNGGSVTVNTTLGCYLGNVHY